MIHRRRASPLHATRGVVASTWCVTVSCAVLAFDHPLVLTALLAAVALAAWGTHAGREIRRVLVLGIPFALAIAAVNALVVRDGVTVLVRGGELPVFGVMDVTLEALVYGLLLGARALIVLAVFAIHSAAVDPDELLRALRRVSSRSALTAALATRMIPVLGRDARRLADAQRCRPGEPASRVAIVRAVAAGALDRAVDVAATLEVRGYGTGGARPPRRRRPWSRHDRAFAASTAAVVAMAVAARVGEWAAFDAYPRVDAPVGPMTLVTAGALALVIALPFADRRGVVRP